MRRLLLLMISILVVCLFCSFASLQSQQQRPAWDNEIASPVMEDALTPQQKEHSKLYEAYERKEKIRDLLMKRSFTSLGFKPLQPGRRYLLFSLIYLPQARIVPSMLTAALT